MSKLRYLTVLTYISYLAKIALVQKDVSFFDFEIADELRILRAPYTVFRP